MFFDFVEGFGVGDFGVLVFVGLDVVGDEYFFFVVEFVFV